MILCKIIYDMYFLKSFNDILVKNRPTYFKIFFGKKYLPAGYAWIAPTDTDEAKVGVCIIKDFIKDFNKDFNKL